MRCGDLRRALAPTRQGDFPGFQVAWRWKQHGKDGVGLETKLATTAAELLAKTVAAQRQSWQLSAPALTSPHFYNIKIVVQYRCPAGSRVLHTHFFGPLLLQRPCAEPLAPLAADSRSRLAVTPTLYIIVCLY